MTISRHRTLVAGAAMLSVASLPALTRPDPAVAAVERARKAWNNHGAVCQREPTLSDGCPAVSTAEYAAWEEASEAACDEDMAALDEMLATRPTTIAGAAAIVRAFADMEAFAYRGLVKSALGKPA